MDYCHPCRRHLNGALACAGCGTPADALVPYAVADLSGRGVEPVGETLVSSGSAGHRGRARGTARRRPGHRRRGRALLLTVAGAVLALGALSLAELAIEPGGDSGASKYVSEATPTTTTGPGPSAPSSTEPDVPGPVEAPTVVPDTGSPSATATAGPARTTAPEVLPSASVPVDAAPTSSAPPAEPGGTEAPAEPSESGAPTASPTSPEPTDDPTPAPTPSPSETCDWWDWLCF
ncbi:hypothetical protein [Streptomyces sp. NPDC014623]|uniref:SCO2400 family protein n=1 Tax=Streptomyces sp. NPDC014623 TaxID=3364875 RepID=UPI0036FF6A3C